MGLNSYRICKRTIRGSTLLQVLLIMKSWFWVSDGFDKSMKLATTNLPLSKTSFQEGKVSLQQT